MEKMSQYSRMKKGLLYDPGDNEILGKQRPYQEKLQAFNQLGTNETGKQKYMREVFAECGKNSYIELPMHANWGGHHVHLGSNVYINSNASLVDDGHIYIGDHVMFGPNVTIITAGHPIEPELRSRQIQYNRDVRIGDNVWIGAGAIVLPGVHIGENTVIGAGSIVTRDIPDNVVAVGNPCRVLRAISERDSQYFYRDELIDWENL